jgi:hypothetical protein
MAANQQTRHTDPFWDKVIVAHDTVAVYPLQEVTVEVDNRVARVYYNSRQEVTIVTSIKAAANDERSEGNAEDQSS